MSKNFYLCIFLTMVIAVFAIPFSFFTQNDTAFAEDKTYEKYYKLNDDKIIPTQNQMATSLCWAFSASRTLETYLLNFDITINISETFASLAYANYVRDASLDISEEANNNLNYVVGNSGHSLYFQRGLNTYGLATENDVPNSLVSTIREAGEDSYSTILAGYSQYANTSLVTDLNFVWIGDLNTEKDAVLNVKNYLVNYGSVYTQVNMMYMQDNNETKCIYTPQIDPPRTNHAVSIVGWDDEYTYNNMQGAFIVMNSYGENDEFIYVMYEDYNVLGFAKGIQSIKINGEEYTTILYKNQAKDKDFNVVIVCLVSFLVTIVIVPVASKIKSPKTNNKLDKNAWHLIKKEYYIIRLLSLITLFLYLKEK